MDFPCSPSPGLSGLSGGLFYLLHTFLSVLQSSEKFLALIRAGLGEGFAAASVPLPVVRTEK